MSVQNIVNINESNLQQTLEQSMTTPVLFYFWSERSQHCLQLTPVLESLAAQYHGQFILAKLDCDAEQMIAAQFGLRAIPDSLSVPEWPTGRWFPGAAAGRGDPRSAG